MKNTTTTNRKSPVPGRAFSFLFEIVDQLGALVMTLEHWRQQQQTSMQFAHIDPRTLRDAGISEAQRFIGVNRPY